MIEKLMALPWQTQTALLVLALVVFGFALHRARKSTGTFDRRFASIVMLAGLAWSAEAMYSIATETFGIEKEVALVICSVFEAALWVLMRRAERAMEEFGWPGKAGRYVWFLAVGMGLVAAANAHQVDHADQWSFGAATFRLAIPLTVTALWWSGLVGEGEKPEGSESSWLWTPNKILVRVGLKAPGKNDVAKVQRDWLADRMTKLEFARQFGPEKDRDKVKMKLAKLALSADGEVVEVVRERVRLASAFVSGDLSALFAEPVRTALSASAEPVRTDKPSPDKAPDNDVRAAQEPVDEMTDDDYRQMIASMISTDNPATGKAWTVRELSAVLGIGKTKVSELKRELVARADNEIVPIAFTDDGRPFINGAALAEVGA